MKLENKNKFNVITFFNNLIKLIHLMQLILNFFSREKNMHTVVESFVTYCYISE